MGERDPGLAKPAAAPPPWRQRAALAVALAALLAVVAWRGPLSSPAVEPEPAPTPSAVTSPAAAPDDSDAALAQSLAVAAARAVGGARGEAVLGVLLLGLAAALACRSLEPRLGPATPALVGLLIFGSCAWALVWTEGGALTPLALAVAAFALAYDGARDESPAELYRPPERGWRGALRWLAVGLLLAQLVPGAPLLAGLLLPAALAVPRERRRAFVPVLLAGFVAGLAAEVAVRGPAGLVRPIGLAAETLTLDPELAGRSLLSLAAGRNVGLLSGFAPLLLVLVLGRGGSARPALLASGLVLPALAALLLPFDFAAGWLNLSLLPVYGALWHLPRRPPRPWQWGAAALAAGLVSWPLWLSPGAALAGDGAALAASWPRRLLPYETALRSLPSYGELALAGEVRARLVAGGRLRGVSGRLETAGAGPLVLWLATPPALERVGLEAGPGAPSSFEVGGGETGRTVFRPDGRVGYEVLLSNPRGRHRLWLDGRPRAVHLIEVRLPLAEGGGPLRLRLVAAPEPPSGA